MVGSRVVQNIEANPYGITIVDKRRNLPQITVGICLIQPHAMFGADSSVLNRLLLR